jgi:hypothetical protein
MKEKTAVIANNPLSKNIARILKYEPGMMESELRREAGKISDKIKEKYPKKSLNFETIMTWILADKERPERARMFIGFEKLKLFAEAVGIDYWKLFVPDTLIDPDILPAKKKEAIEMIMRIDDDRLMEDIQKLIIIRVDKEAERVLKLRTDIFNIREKPKDNNQ